MRERDINRKQFHAGHYNIVAGRLKNALEPYVGLNELSGASQGQFLHAQTALSDLCVSFALRFQADNEDFDAVRFLNACSPAGMERKLDDLWNDELYQAFLSIELVK